MCSLVKNGRGLLIENSEYTASSIDQCQGSSTGPGRPSGSSWRNGNTSLISELS